MGCALRAATGHSGFHGCRLRRSPTFGDLVPTAILDGNYEVKPLVAVGPCHYTPIRFESVDQVQISIPIRYLNPNINPGLKGVVQPCPVNSKKVVALCAEDPINHLGILFGQMLPPSAKVILQGIPVRPGLTGNGTMMPSISG